MFRPNDNFFYGFTLWNANNVPSSSLIKDRAYFTVKTLVRETLLNAGIDFDYHPRADFMVE
jgi:hypothetical protein